MNTVALTGQRNFPITTDALAFMQGAYGMLENFSKLAGDNYILSGCTVTGASVSSGMVVIGGRLMPFAGGSIQENVKVVTTVTPITVGAGSREQTSYSAEFGTSTNPVENIGWGTLNANRVINLLAMSMKIDDVNTELTDFKEVQTTKNTELDEKNTSQDESIDANHQKLLSMPYVVGGVFVESDGTILEQFSSHDITFSVTKHGAGAYCVTHNLGSAKYIAIVQVAQYDLGTPNDTPSFESIKVGGLKYTRNRVTVWTGDDESGNDCRFMLHLLKTDNGDFGFYN